LFAVRALRLVAALLPERQPSSHGPGVGRLSPPDTSRHPAKKQAAEPYPDPIRSNTSRREATAAPGGEPDAARAVSPHKPAVARKRDATTSACVAPHRTLSRDGRPEQAPCILLMQHARPRSGWAPDCSRNPRPRPRAASLEAPRRAPRSAAPKVSSIAELPSGRTKAFTRFAVQVGRSPQVVANMWKTRGATFRLLRNPTVLTDWGRGSPCLRCNWNWAETQEVANRARGLPLSPRRHPSWSKLASLQQSGEA